jgi:hypothetical protein
VTGDKTAGMAYVNQLARGADIVQAGLGTKLLFKAWPKAPLWLVGVSDCTTVWTTGPCHPGRHAAYDCFKAYYTMLSLPHTPLHPAHRAFICSLSQDGRARTRCTTMSWLAQRKRSTDSPCLLSWTRMQIVTIPTFISSTLGSRGGLSDTSATYRLYRRVVCTAQCM